ncbi:MAG: hypothetical protein OXI02_00425 [Candidatus Dadabacteria bacterium]|nr:hypothetical protein [Candidatus Dadabacteria bacterium]MDE0292061.1 hypothetical protein [Candidatus Dadabacteria bacterium]MDE0476515.1 hypothetical protein [Candidatus Dadabacteria bacterium]
MDNPCRFALWSFALGVFLVSLATGCGGGGGGGEQAPPVTPPVMPQPTESLVLRTADTADLSDYFGEVYSGTYTASDGVSIDVWVSLRESNAQTGIGTVSRLGVIIQGGTGSKVTGLLSEDQGAHTAWVAINYRGSNITDITAGKECAPGRNFIACLKGHDTFSKINPVLNARDANSVIRMFAEDEDVTVNGKKMKASDFVPSGTVRSPVNLYTSSFGGVIVGYMLAENDRPRLHNVFFEQVTAPGEHPISDGLHNAARMMDILFSACEDDSSCTASYPDIRENFRRFMDTYHSTPVRIDGETVYAGGAFDRIVHLVEEEQKVGRAIRYIGEIANAHDRGEREIATGYGPRDYSSMSGEHPRETYGLPDLDGDEARWTDLLVGAGGFFPGITNRTGMICSFGINRAEDPDSLSRYDEVGNEELPGDNGGTKEAFGYGFLVGYKTYLSVCPHLVEQTGRIALPRVSGIEAENVIVYRGGLDIKHYFSPDPRQDEIMAYFSGSPDHRLVITHRFLGQEVGEDSECLRKVLGNFWDADDTTDVSLGDDCEESNDFPASELSGW